jgi:hypothetical protein
MSDRRRFLKGLTSLPLATVLASPRLAATRDRCPISSPRSTKRHISESFSSEITILAIQEPRGRVARASNEGA